MRVLVTGASGFVGRVVVTKLETCGHRVVAATRSRLAGVAWEQAIVCEIGPQTDWSAALRGIDAVVHLAARVHVMRDSAAGTLEFERVNAEGTRQLALA